MVYVIIAFIITLILVLLIAGIEIDSNIFAIGIFLFVIISVCITKIGTDVGYSDPKYRNVNYTYNITEIQGNDYYKLNAGSDSVSVLIDKGSGIKMETFPKDVVTFVETTDSAKITMDLKIFQKSSKADEIWFNKPAEPNEEFPEKIYKSVTIYVPINS